MRTYIAALVALACWLGVAHADKKQYRYVGIHPIAKAAGGGVCHIGAPHVHVYAPIDVKVQFRDHDGWNYFVGDPVAYGWDGPKTSYYGHHPVPVDVIVADDHPDTEYCYLEGPHFHAWAPPAELKLELRAGAYWYVGDFPPAYAAGRATYDPIDVVYQPLRYERPAVVVDAAGLRIGIVGVMTYGALRATLPLNVRGLRMAPLAETVSAEAERLRASGAQLVVLSAHAGGGCDTFDDPRNLSSCDPNAEIFDLARDLRRGAVDAIVAGHTHAGLAHEVAGIPIVQSFWGGRAFGRIDLVVDLDSGRIVDSPARLRHT